MRARLKKLLAKDARSRQSHAWRKRRSALNWPIQKKRVLEVFEEFANQYTEMHEFIHIGDHVDEMRSDPDFKYYGEDNVALTFIRRLTGRRSITRKEDGSISHERQAEDGASLIIHFTEVTGYFQVFLVPPKLSDEKRTRTDVLIAASLNLDDLTPNYVCKLISKLLVFRRVESVMEGSSRLDRMRVRWWRFKDVRNRRGYLDRLDIFVTPWEQILIAALVGLLGLSLFTDAMAKVWELSGKLLELLNSFL